MKKIKISIGFKLIFFFILMLIISLGISSYYSYQNYSKTLVDESESELKAISALKKKAIEGYFDELLSDLSISAKSPILRINFSDYDRRVNKKLDKAVSDYLDLLKEEHGWYDAFLMDLEGNVIYTVEKEDDYATNLENGVYRDSGLAKAYKKGRKELSIIDFSYYEASKGIAAFVSAPIKDKNNQLRGVIALQVPIDKINNIMQERTGMGRSGETYLVGSDYLMRSNSRFGNGKDILKKEVNTSSVRKSLQGEEGVDTIKDYRDIKVLSYHTPLQIKDHNWVLIAEVDEAEVMEPLNNLIKKVYKMTWIIALVIILLSGLLIFFLIIRPVKKVQSIMNKIANNNLSSEVEFKSNDELGEMSNDINKTISSLNGILKRIRSSAESVSKSSNQIASDNSNLAERT
ncbi:PDC sensor domain-containing protein [Orenia marismortui]|uniref:PDC sensor domain-containing protein n=1 Tax=Orenia marismortui TaxID=46469 RepID=UPI00035DB71D|nr:methyl-accepting chemotaxis protein [Orenia marismortui]